MTEAENLIAQADNILDMLRLAAVVNYSIKKDENESQDNFQKAIRIRDHIYQNVPLRQAPKNFDFMNIDECYLSSLRDERVGHICGGLAIIYATALESQSIPVRYVGIFSTDKQPYDSHATIEFWHEGKWYASDPTFNVMFKHRGEYLSYSELYDLIKKGESYEIVSNGFPVFPKRAIERYYIKLEDLMKYMVIHPSEVWIRGMSVQHPMQLFPTTWDGGITYNDGERRDVRNFGGIYEFLNAGPLR
jgi:hypothetical protein